MIREDSFFIQVSLKDMQTLREYLAQVIILASKRFLSLVTPMQDWDPIGVSGIPEARDEYDSYVPDVHQMLVHRASAGEVFEYLLKITAEHMGLSANQQQIRRAAEKLVGLVDKIEGP